MKIFKKENIFQILISLLIVISILVIIFTWMRAYNYQIISNNSINEDLGKVNINDVTEKLKSFGKVLELLYAIMDFSMLKEFASFFLIYNIVFGNHKKIVESLILMTIYIVTLIPLILIGSKYNMVDFHETVSHYYLPLFSFITAFFINYTKKNEDKII